MTDLAERLRQIERNSSPDLWDEITSRTTIESSPGGRRGLRHRVAAGLVAAVVSIAAFVFLVSVFRSGDDHGGPRLPNESSQLGRPVINQPIPYPSDQAYGGGIATGAGSVWVGLASGQNNADGSILRIDPTTNEIVAEITIAGTTFRNRLAATDDAVWVATTGGVVQRIDPTTDTVVGEIDLGAGVSALAADESAVWAIVIDDRSDQGLQNQGRLVRIDPATNEVIAEVALGDAATGYEDSIIVGDGSVWVLGSRLVAADEEDGGDLVRIDPSSNTVAASIPVDGFRMVMAEDGRTIWVRSPEDGLFDESREAWVWRTVATSTNAVSAPFAFPSDLDEGLSAVDDQALWAVSYDKNESVVVVRFEPETLEVVGESKPIENLFTDAIVDVESGRAWITTATEGVVLVDL